MSEKGIGYDEFDLARIWTVLLKIKHWKKLTWTQLAAQVQAQSGVIFDRKYFHRLKDGKLGTERVHAVVLTISSRYVPNFEDDLENRNIQGRIRFNSLEAFSDIRSNIFEFNRMSRENTKIFSSKIRYQGSSHLDPLKVEIFESEVSFFRDTYLYRIVEHVDIPAKTTYLLSSPSSAVPLDRSIGYANLLDSFSPSISANSIFDLALFFARFFYRVDITPIISLNAALTHSLDTGLDIAGAIERLEIDIPPSIASVGSHFTGSFLAVEMDKLQRVHFEVGPTGEVLRFDQSTLAVVETSPADQQTVRRFEGVVFKQHPCREQLLTSVRSHLKKSEVGRLFDNLCASGMLDLKFFAAHEFSVVYDSIGVSVVTSAPHIQRFLSERNILDIVKKIRFADQHLLGFTTPPVEGDLLEYATVVHSKALDSIIYSLKFVDTYEDETGRRRLIDALDTTELKLFEAIRRSAKPAELFDIYAGISQP